MAEYVLDVAKEFRAVDQCIASELSEAAIFHAGRICESTFNRLVKTVSGSAKDNAFSNIENAQSWNILTPSVHIFAHTLRRLTNDVRHVLRPVQLEDSIVASAIAEVIVGSSRIQSLLSDLKVVSECPDRRRASPVAQCLADVSDENATVDSIVRNALESQSLPVFCFAIERLLNRKHGPEARRLLDEAASRENWKRSLRLMQLEGLWLSWASIGVPDAERKCEMLNGAEQILLDTEKLYPTQPETIGILAGVLKRRAEASDSRSDRLRCRDLYESGWKASGEADTYLGINAAFMSLVLGEREKCRSVADKVHNRLQSNKKFVTAHRLDRSSSAEFWTLATEAEALLLLTYGSGDDARRLYEEAMREFPILSQNHEIALKQANTIRKLCSLDPWKLGSEHSLIAARN